MAVLPAVKAAIWSVNPEQRFTGETVTLERYMDRLIAQRRFNMAVLALFGVLGLVIAAVGIYGVMAYVVAQRTNEIGVRMALGATRGNVVSMVLRRAGALMVARPGRSAALGAWYLSAGLKSFLFEVQPNDLGIFAAALAVLACAGTPGERAAGAPRGDRGSADCAAKRVVAATHAEFYRRFRRCRRNHLPKKEKLLISYPSCKEPQGVSPESVLDLTP